MSIQTVEDFKAYVAECDARDGYVKPQAFGLGVRRARNGTTLDVLFPLINFEANYGSATIVAAAAGVTGSENTVVSFTKEALTEVYNKFAPFHADAENHGNVALLESLVSSYEDSNDYADVDVVAFFAYDLNSAVASAEEAYFKLQTISQRHVQPHGLTLDGAFGALANVAWTNYGPILPADLPTQRVKYQFTNQPLVVSHIDKFPYLVDYHAPSGCRITSNSQVRLGAHLGEGTTVMPAGYINFNAGTAGNAMVEGRISAGVFVGEGSDVGGGASIMGTLSGGNNHVISIGEKCLLGANAGTGISLGNGCTIAAGLYIYGGMKVSLYNASKEPVNTAGEVVAEGANVVKASEISGRDDMLFIQDSETGKVICRPNGKAIELNAALHSND